MLILIPIAFVGELVGLNVKGMIRSIWLPIQYLLTPFVLMIAIIFECFIYQNATGLIVCATIWPFYVYDVIDYNQENLLPQHTFFIKFYGLD